MKKQKKIVIITHRFYPIIGGAEHQALLLAKNLSLRGNDVCVLTSKIENSHRNEVIDDVSVVRFNKYNKEKNFYFFILLFNLHVLLYLCFRLRQFDKVIYFFGIDFFAISAFPLKVFGKETMIRTATPSAAEVGGNYKNAKFYKFRRPMLEAFSKFIAITSEIETNLLYEGIESARIIRISNGVDTGLFYPLCPKKRNQLRKQLNLEEDKIYILFCGHFYKTKGLDFLIDSLIELGKSQYFPNVELLVLGGSQSIPKLLSLEEDIVNMLRQQQLSIKINFLGQINNREKYFQAADIFVLPSQSEGMPNVLLEAMSCALACIATNVGGVPDVIQHGITGYLVKYGNKIELGNAVCELINDDYLRKNMGKHAFRSIETHNGIKMVAKAYETILKNIL